MNVLPITSVTSLFRRHRGERLTIIGCGPALTGFNWSRLNGKLTVAMNLAILAPCEFTYWFVIDELKRFGVIDAKTLRSKAPLVSCNHEDRPDYLYGKHHLQKSEGSVRRAFQRGLFVWVPRVLGMALQFAKFLGVIHVDLLGCDFVRTRAAQYFFDIDPGRPDGYKTPQREIEEEVSPGLYSEYTLSRTTSKLTRVQKYWGDLKITRYGPTSPCMLFESKSLEEF